MSIILASKWFGWPPHWIHDVVKGLEDIVMVLTIIIEWITREWL